MRVGIRFKSILSGILLIGATAALVGVYVWLERAPIEPGRFSGQQLFLLLFAPLVAGLGVFGVVSGLKIAYRGATAYVLSERSLTIRAPLRSRSYSWSDVRDFRLPPANFPRPPRNVVLLFARQAPVKLPLGRVAAAGALDMLIASVPGLAEWGIERVRPEEPTTLSPIRTRWRLYKATAFALYAAPIFLLFLIAGGILISRDFVNYLRIDFHHDTARARITDIQKESDGRDQSVWARVQYTDWAGDTVRLHRKVMVSFADRFHPGDMVAVDYLHDHPGVGRIPGWDLDRRQCILLIILVPMLWILYRKTRLLVGQWVGPLRDHIAWAARPASHHLAFSGASLDTLYPLLPEAHAGTLVLKPPSASSQKAGLDPWLRWMTRAGLVVRKSLGTFLILEPRQAQRAMDRLGGENPFAGDYMVLNCATADEAERFLTNELPHLNPDSTGGEAARARVYLLKKGVGPIDDLHKPELFQNWLMQRLRRLYGGAPSAGNSRVGFRPAVWNRSAGGIV